MPPVSIDQLRSVSALMDRSVALLSTSPALRSPLRSADVRNVKSEGLGESASRRDSYREKKNMAGGDAKKERERERLICCPFTSHSLKLYIKIYKNKLINGQSSAGDTFVCVGKHV